MKLLLTYNPKTNFTESLLREFPETIELKNSNIQLKNPPQLAEGFQLK